MGCSSFSRLRGKRRKVDGQERSRPLSELVAPDCKPAALVLCAISSDSVCSISSHPRRRQKRPEVFCLCCNAKHRKSPLIVRNKQGTTNNTTHTTQSNEKKYPHMLNFFPTSLVVYGSNDMYAPSSLHQRRHGGRSAFHGLVLAFWSGLLWASGGVNGEGAGTGSSLLLLFYLRTQWVSGMQHWQYEGIQFWQGTMETAYVPRRHYYEVLSAVLSGFV